MERSEAFALFEEMIGTARSTLFPVSTSTQLDIERKADRTVVTECDRQIDERLSRMAASAGVSVVSEEGDHARSVVLSGNYMTIDPIDGTLGYLDYMNHASSDRDQLFAEDLGATKDFCLLIGLVEDATPRFGAVHNYVTQETILIDGDDAGALIRRNMARPYTHPIVVYVDQRPGDALEDELRTTPNAEIVTQAALGLKSVYTIINSHDSAITAHRVQRAGLWDVLPAAVAARSFGGTIYDDHGVPLMLNQYVMLPGNGATVIKGKAFEYVPDRLQSEAK